MCKIIKRSACGLNLKPHSNVDLESAQTSRYFGTTTSTTRDDLTKLDTQLGATISDGGRKNKTAATTEKMTSA